MNTIWSTYVQKIDTLYFSRTLRFADIFKDKYQRAFMIDDKKEMLEIGCGPGALSQSLHRWYQNASITGIDRDSKFIEFATKQAPEIVFKEDDATHLSFQDNTFDVTISNTVQEHIEPSTFFAEQYRVLKENGICLVLSARRGINVIAPCVSEQTDFEKDIWKRTEIFYKETDKKYNVCAYPLNEAELPLCMEQYGFRNVTTEYITVNLTPDNPIYSKQMAHDMINANRKCALNGAEYLLDIALDAVTVSEVDELKRIINSKYDKRIDLYDRGIKQWDTSLSVTMILRGTK
jgi:ubiquinone/menaquinone biosynthesis C-methylase UbiE